MKAKKAGKTGTPEFIGFSKEWGSGNGAGIKREKEGKDYLFIIFFIYLYLYIYIYAVPFGLARFFSSSIR